jgi:hypothetical protein
VSTEDAAAAEAAKALVETAVEKLRRTVETVMALGAAVSCPGCLSQSLKDDACEQQRHLSPVVGISPVRQ